MLGSVEKETKRYLLWKWRVCLISLSSFASEDGFLSGGDKALHKVNFRSETSEILTLPVPASF